MTLALIPPSTALGQPADRPPKGADAATGSGPPAGAAVETGAKPPPFVLVEGQITDLTGGGQEGASVIVRRQREDGKPGEVLGRGTTDKLGDFRVTSKKRIRGDIVVTVSMPKFSDLTRTFHLSDDDEFPPYLAEALEGKVVVIGRVVDAQNDQPVEKAAVKLTAADRDWSATTDEDGRFVIKGVVPGRGVLIVEAAGSGKERQRVGRLENFGEILVRLKPQRVVRVEVVDESQR
ncbi:MAG: carboxypeptidase-like regulatory domain-containing protein, partial [Phycisphaerae bacterium]